MKSIVPVQSCSVKFYIPEFVRKQELGTDISCKKRKCKYPVWCWPALERIFEFIDQNVKKNTLNSNDVQRERERERELSVTSEKSTQP